MPPLRSYLIRGLRLLPLTLLVWSTPVYALDFNAFWLYRESGGEKVDTRRDFQQRYTLGAGPGISFQPTHAISAGANLSYTRTQRDLGRGMETIEEVTPSAFVGVINDLFAANLSGQVTEHRPDSGQDFTTRSWNAFLGSNWQRELWPVLRFNYGESSESGGGPVGVTALDIEEKHYSAGVDWDLRLARLFYEYSRTQRDDLFYESRSDSESHFARLETGRSFWQRRIHVSLAQQYQESTQDFSDLAPVDGLFTLRLEGGQVLAAVTDPLNGPDPEDVEPVGNPQLADRDLGLPALSVGSGERVHLALRFDFEQQIDQMHLFLDPLAPLPLTSAQAADLHWDLYTRDPLDTGWILATSGIPASFDPAEQRFVLDIGLRGRQIMVTATNPAGTSLIFTEVEAIGLLSGDVRGRQRSHLTNASLRVQLTRTLAATSSLIVERIDSDFGGSESETTRRSLTGGLRWTPAPFISPFVGVNESRQRQTGVPEEINRAYSLIVTTLPLPTLNVTLGATRTDRFSDARKTSTSDNYSLTSTARIYPDLTASLNVSYITTDREGSDGTTVSSDSFTSRLMFNARLNPALIADLVANYREAESDTSGETSSTDTTLSLLYRPSDLLSMRLSGTRVWSGTESPDTLAFNMTLGLVRTYNTRMTFRYTHLQGREASDSVGLDGSWDISPALSLQSRMDYRFADEDAWNLQASLALRL